MPFDFFFTTKLISALSLYISPIYNFPSRELTELIYQLQAPFISIGDVNANNPLRGSDKVIDKGILVKDVLSYLNLYILNDGSNTYLHSGNGFYSSIDSTIVDTSLLLHVDLH